MTMNPKNRSDLGIANSDCSYLSPEALCQNGCCIWVFWWILPTKFHSHSQHEWISPKWLWHMRCPIGTACMGILIKNCVSEICIIIWQVCGAYGVKTRPNIPYEGGNFKLFLTSTGSVYKNLHWNEDIFKSAITWIKGEALVGDPICDPGEAAKGLIFCTGLDNNAAKVISLVESAFDLMEGAGEAPEEVEAAGDVIAWPLTNRSNKEPVPTLLLVGSTSEFNKACKLGAVLVLAVTSLVLKIFSNKIFYINNILLVFFLQTKKKNSEIHSPLTYFQTGR